MKGISSVGQILSQENPFETLGVHNNQMSERSEEKEQAIIENPGYYSRVHGVDGDGLPVDALGDLDRRHRGEAVGRVGHEELQAELGQTWKRKQNESEIVIDRVKGINNSGWP